ncbi:hypothetical protein [Flavobacterium johnsoniae]|uniref:hypothetical protein n=1 Tax=Flavobacterium johnsoniae TaxID=986 RepID=UPI003D98E66A
MMPKDKIQLVNTIWDNYIKTNRIVLDAKGKELVNIDDARRFAIIELKKIIDEFQKGNSNISEFKTSIDSYNKRNNL